jgi:outer membrane protein
VVDVQRVILETREGRRAKKDLERTFSRSQARLEAKQRALQKRYEDLQAKAPMLSQKMLLQRQQDLMRSQQELEQLTMELQEEIVQKEGLLTEKIYKKVAVIVRQIALEEKVQAVLVRGDMTVLFVNPKLDLTNRVIVAYDKKHK